MDELERELRDLGDRIRAVSTPPPVGTVRRRYRRRQVGRGAAATLLSAALVTGVVLGPRVPLGDRPTSAASTANSPTASAPAPDLPSLRPLPPQPRSPSPTRVAPSKPPTPPAGRPSAPGPPATAPSCRGDLLDVDLDDGSVADFDDHEGRVEQIRVVPDPAGGTGQAARVELSRDDSESDATPARAQLTEDDAGTPHGDRDRCFSFSTYLPRDWVSGPADALFDIHARATEGCEEARSPLLGLVVVDDRMTWGNRWDSRQCTPGNEPEGRGRIAEAPVRRGEWVDWVVRVHWSYGPDGLVEIWENGRLLARHAGPNAYNDVKGFYLMIGDSAYDGLGTADRHVSYFDDVRMGTGTTAR